ncbi:hypothetical protein [Indioceanicola profundi]|uniref:hypothetical protein n=1 Tax=Indioceanicola profundi TaxID=2220096 RepID=UPI0019699D8B|nr:hypothetical protein [Indioceanicola profundi]
MQPASNETAVRDGKEATILSGIAAVAGMGALGAASCCALPLLFAGVGLGGAGLAPLLGLAVYRTEIFLAAGLLLAGSWALFLRASRRPSVVCVATGACKPSAGRRWITLSFLTAATVLLLGAGWTASNEAAVVQTVATWARG